MANLHPSFPLSSSGGAGAYRERDILHKLQAGLPPQFDLFHNMPWSVVMDGAQHVGETDIVVVAPSGDILLLEVKAGDVIEKPNSLQKNYNGKTKDVGAQVRRQHSSLLTRMQNGDLPKVHIGSLLVLPDHRITGSCAAYPRDRIVDASDMDKLCTRVMHSFVAQGMQHKAPTKADPHAPQDERQRVLDFMGNRFNTMPDVATHIGQMQGTNTRLAAGMAQWVPKVQHAQGAYVVEATAGSGKTQLALALLQAAAHQKLKARYVCFNRPLADHLAQLTPAAVDVTTFHQLCRDHAERTGLALDFAQPDVFGQMEQRYLQDAEQQAPRLDLLVIDESQDLDAAWLQALMASLRPDGRLYVMGDSAQQLYEREGFELPEAVHIRCMDNFRSPRQVVQTLNALGLTPEPIDARSVCEGDAPNFHEHGPGQGEHLKALNHCLQQLWQQGMHPEQVAVLSYKGVKNAQVLTLPQLGGHATRRYTGQYDKTGNPRWSEGPLLVESLYRFKGQSMPVVVLCEVDFETLSEQDRRKLFVGLTRAQLRVEVVISQRAASALKLPPKNVPQS